jgi:hypothetical protein
VFIEYEPFTHSAEYRSRTTSPCLSVPAATLPNRDWWDRAKLPPRPQPIEIRKRERLCTLRKGEHEIMLEKRDVPAIGEELILSVNARWRRMRVFRLQDEPLLGSAVAETVASLEVRGWRVTLGKNASN